MSRRDRKPLAMSRSPGDRPKGTAPFRNKKPDDSHRAIAPAASPRGLLSRAGRSRLSWLQRICLPAATIYCLR